MRGENMYKTAETLEIQRWHVILKYTDTPDNSRSDSPFKAL